MRILSATAEMCPTLQQASQHVICYESSILQWMQSISAKILYFIIIS